MGGSQHFADETETALRREFARRLQLGLTRRMQPHGQLTLTGLAAKRIGSRKTLREWMEGKREFSLTDLRRIDAEAASLGLPGLYDEVTRGPRKPSWVGERLSLDGITDQTRGDFLAAWRSGADPLEAAGNLGLLRFATLLSRQGNDFISEYVGPALPIDKSVLGRPILDRSDPDYAGLLQTHMEATRGEATLYRLKSDLYHYTRLAIPGQRLIITLPFDSSETHGWKVR